VYFVQNKGEVDRISFELQLTWINLFYC